MSTTRENILDRIKTDLTAVTGVNYVTLLQPSPVDLETIAMPAIFIYTGPETRLSDNRAVIGYENWQWEVILEVWARDTDMEALLGLIHAAMFADEELGNYAVISYRTGVDMQIVDPEQSLQVMVISYEVIYRHVKGVM